MGLIASLPEIDKQHNSVFVMHEKSEKWIPMHSHAKGQLSYVEGGIAYIMLGSSTYVVPARHFFWIPGGELHMVQIGRFATVFRSLYFYTDKEEVQHPFYGQLGIYLAPELLIQMINYTERWDSLHVTPEGENFELLVAIKKLLPGLKGKALHIVLPVTQDERMQQICRYLDKNLSEPLSLSEVSTHFSMSARSLSRLFQLALPVSFLQYLKTLRIVKAIELLLKTDKPISEIASKTGYNNVKSFSNVFLDFTHCRPTDFRRRGG